MRKEWLELAVGVYLVLFMFGQLRARRPVVGTDVGGVEADVVGLGVEDGNEDESVGGAVGEEGATGEGEAGDTGPLELLVVSLYPFVLLIFQPTCCFSRPRHHLHLHQQLQQQKSPERPRVLSRRFSSSIP